MPATRLENLPAHARDLASRSLDWMDACWDADVALFRTPHDKLYEAGKLGVPGHLVRESGWYALGLLLRNRADDRERAIRTLESVLNYQFDAPDQPYHGTWYRSPHEPPPPANPREWKDYDPNWREFIGTTLALILIEYADQLPAALIERIDAALQRAAVGTLARRVSASYTNIALMTAFLLQFAGERYQRPEWTEASSELAEQIWELFRRTSTFEEFNSPTYYGIDLYALALWRSYATQPFLREKGAAIERRIWQEIAQTYHAEMRNIVGPYDRSYSMDMRNYVSCLALWIWLITGYERAPFPDIRHDFGHNWDFALAPAVALLGLDLPSELEQHFRQFSGPRSLRIVINHEPERVATAYLAERIMLGGEEAPSSHRPNNSQYHPATLHWLSGQDNQLGWIKINNTAPIRAQAEGTSLRMFIQTQRGGELNFSFRIGGDLALSFEMIERGRWRLPGLNIDVMTQAESVAVEQAGNELLVSYTARNLPPRAMVRCTLIAELV